MKRPCLTCGLPSEDSRCPEHQPKSWQHREGSARARGYDRTWDKLSIRARRMQPFCSLCFSTENLTTDHLPSAWRRKAEGKAIRLRDVRVLCSPCNVDAGSSRPDDMGRGAIDGRSGPPGEAQSPLHTFADDGDKSGYECSDAAKPSGGDVVTAIHEAERDQREHEQDGVETQEHWGILP